MSEVDSLLYGAIVLMEQAMPLLEEMNGMIPTNTLDLIDKINEYSVKY